MRTISGGDRTLLAGSFALYTKVEVQNGSGSMIDVSSYVTDVNISNSVDTPVARATVQFTRGYGSTSLAPMHSTSVLNVNNGGSYSPLLNPNRRILISVSTVALNAAAGAYTPIFDGVIDLVDPGSELLTVECRDKFAVLLDTQIEIEASYGAEDPGEASETVIQSIINDNVLVNPPAVTLPGGSPDWNLLPFIQASGISVMEAIRALALQRGWDIRGRWAGNNYQLAYYQPDYASPSVLTTFGPSEYIEIPSAPISKENIRNFIEVVYTDAASGQVATATANDPVSELLYGHLWMRIVEGSTSNIDEDVEAQAMADAALAALSKPDIAHTMETALFWPVEIGDYYGFLANDIHYTSQQNAAVFSYTHHWNSQSHRTTIQAQGYPSGAYSEWQDMSEVPPEGLDPILPEFRYVNAPVAVYEAGVIVGWRVSGKVDTNTNAIIIVLSPSLSLRVSVPDYVTASNPPDTEYWLDMTPGGSFTLELDLLQGGGGQLLMTPASIYNPEATIPPARGGLLGPVFVQPLSRAPTTSIVTTNPSSTSFAVTLSVRPASATIKYRHALAAIAPTDPWTAVQNAQGSITFIVDVSNGFVMLEYYSVSVDDISEEIHSIRLDEGLTPLVQLSIAENTPNWITATVAINDNVVEWALWAKRGGDYPDLYPPSFAMDPQYLKFTGNRQKTEVEFYAQGNGVGPTQDQWICVAVGYDQAGNESPRWGAVILIQGSGGSTPTAGAISGLTAQLSLESGIYYIDLEWANNSVIEAAAASRFGVRILENSVEKYADQAKKDHLGTDATPGRGGWHRPCSPAGAGDPGANYLTFFYDVELYDTGTLVFRATTSISGWFLGSGFGTAPTTTPNVPVVAQNPDPSGLMATWSPTGLDPLLNIEILWHWSNDDFATHDAFFMNDVLMPLTTEHLATGLIRPRRARCRLRYWNTYGSGPWTAWSNSEIAPFIILH